MLVLLRSFRQRLANDPILIDRMRLVKRRPRSTLARSLLPVRPVVARASRAIHAQDTPEAVHHLSQHRPETLAEFQNIVESKALGTSERALIKRWALRAALVALLGSLVMAPIDRDANRSRSPRLPRKSFGAGNKTAAKCILQFTSVSWIFRELL